MKITKEFQIQVLAYLIENKSASSRKIARGLGQSRPRVKEALRKFLECGLIERWVRGTWVDPEDLVNDAPQAERAEDAPARVSDAPRTEMRIDVRRL